MESFRRISIILVAFILAGCAVRTFEVPANHPASPAASEAPVQPESTTLKVESLNQAPPTEDGAPFAGDTHQQRGQAAAVAPYQCPMHPDVQSDKPGRCPKCGMNLQRNGGGQ